MVLLLFVVVLGCGWVVGELYSGCEHLFVCVFCLSGLVVCLCLFVFCFGFVGRSVDALVPGADEGRCGLRYASGSWLASVDPGVSEWGNPARVIPGHQSLNV